ncbi:thiamine pyrophosphate-binding protein [Oceanibacterium hippocampi]|uniref:Acetolactate synthase isozyme 1 large subunit n=1 Tax=Oceanibacterium hippocampi TaxID=745714 RepID=A0A1Y5TJK0_9PROT|nr:thiamine pyrophosphate-binding protein [Oceanibacterium hippocampi]SLN63464.1 Acetolactate synthase isozyme 1 large subunit [Oceanibacterium hippocampi]
MPEVKTTVGDLVAAFLEAAGVEETFGVISIHNMPMLDAIGRRGNIRYVLARGEAGAVNMADAAARVRGGLTAAFTSTGTACGNAAGAMVEALTAGSPVLHLTGQIDSPYLDRDRGYIHEAPDQPRLLEAVSKASFRVWSPETALGVLREAARIALTPPAGPVSIEIPIDIQKAAVTIPDDLAPIPPVTARPSEVALDALAAALVKARRPLLWLGGGARGATVGAERLVSMGIGVVTSTNGRGIVPEDHPLSLGAVNMVPAVEALYRTCDFMLVAGSRLRGNETRNYKMELPRPLWLADADPRTEGRSYVGDGFVHGDAADILDALADRVAGRMAIDPAFADDLATARETAVTALRDNLGPYGRLIDQLQAVMPRDAVWVRDVTISNSTWGNRLLRIFGPRDGVHALGGGIGQGTPMGIGAAVAAGAQGRKTVTLVGDGGFALSLGELMTAVQERADVVFLLMNDQGYGVIRNIQDVHYGGRRYFADPLAPDFGALSAAMGLAHTVVRDLDDFPDAMAAAIALPGPAMVEIDMIAVGPFKVAFAGPPVPQKAPARESVPA